MAAVLLHGLVPDKTAHSNSAPEHSLVCCAEFLAVVSPAPTNLETLPPEALADLAQRHNAVLVAYCTQATVLPTRFGTAFSSPQAVRDHLDQTSARHAAALQTLMRLDEYTLRLQITGAPPASARPVRSGREFLARGRDQRDQRASLTERRRTLARSLLADLDPICHQIEAAGSARQERLLDIAVLIDKTSRDRLATIAESVSSQVRLLGLELSVVGPWPAYSFRIEEGADGA